MQRIAEHHSALLSQAIQKDLTHHRVEMHGDEKPEIFLKAQQLQHTPADTLQPLPPGLPAVGGEKHHGDILGNACKLRGFGTLHPFGSCKKSVDNGVPRDGDTLLRAPFGEQVRLSPGSGGEPEGTDAVRQKAVHLLRKGLGEIPAPKPRLHMPQGNPPVEGGEGCGKGGGGIPVHQHHIRMNAVEDLAALLKHRCGDVIQSLPLFHDVQKIIRLQAEEAQRLQKHLPMLPRGEKMQLKARIFPHR